MTALNLQSLVLRAACNSGRRATSLESKGRCAVAMGYPAQSLSAPWQPLPGPYANDLGHKPADESRRHAMDSFVGRAGRSAGFGGSAGRVAFARIAGGAILSDWRGTRATAEGIPAGSRGHCERLAQAKRG